MLNGEKYALPCREPVTDGIRWDFDSVFAKHAAEAQKVVKTPGQGDGGDGTCKRLITLQLLQAGLQPCMQNVAGERVGFA